MKNVNRFAVAMIAAAGTVSVAGLASADTIVFSFNYKNLNGAYTHAPSGPLSGNFNANATDIGPDLRSGGFVTRNVAPGGTAQFAAGFVSSPDLANYSMGLSVFNKVGNTASGVGSFVATDANGDTLTGTIVGDRTLDPNTGWAQFGSFVSFSGILTNVSFANNSGDGLFNGTGGTSFDFVNGVIPPFSGALVQLFINTGGGFFTNSFTGIPTEVGAQLVPTPGAAGLLALGGLVAARRRRSR